MCALVPSLPRAAWIVLGGDALSAVGSGLTLPFLMVYLHQVRALELELAGLALSCVAIAGLLGNPVAGWLSDRAGPRQALACGLIVAAAGAVLVTTVRAPWHAVAAASVVGLGAGLMWRAQDALLAAVVEPRERSSVFAVRHATVNAGFAAGGLIAALLVSTSVPRSFELVYLLDAASFLAFTLLLLLVRVPAREPERDATARPSYREILRDRVFLRIWALTALLVTVGYAQFHAAFPAYATGQGGLDAGALGAAFAANAITVVLVQLVALKLCAGRRRTRAVMGLCGLWAATWIATLGAGSLGGGAAAAVGFAAALVLFAVGETLLSPSLTPMVNDIAPERLRGRYNGAYTLAWTSGFIAGPLVTGVAFAAGLANLLMVLLAALCGAAAIAARRLEAHLAPAANVAPAAATKRRPILAAEPATA
jgi:MFS family permease